MRLTNLLRSTASVAVVGAVAFGFAGVASAQSAEQDSPTTIDDIIVTAQKREQNLQDVPIVVTSLSAETLQDAGVRDIKDLQILTPGMTVTSTSSEASTTARIRGVELNYSQQYTFLPGAWRGLGSYANFTYIDTKGDYGSTTTVSRLPNLTPRSWNAGLTWRGYGLDLRLMMNHRSAFFRSATSGNFGTGAGVLPGTMFYEVYQHPRTLWDFKVNYTINRTYSLYLDVYNLTNDYTNNDYLHAFGREIPSYASGPGMSFKAGVTARF